MSYTYPVPDYSANIEKSLKIPTECLKKRARKDLQNTTQKTKARTTRTPLKTVVNSGAHEA